MGIAWPGPDVRRGWQACCDARGPEGDGATGVRYAFGAVREGAAGGQAAVTGTRADARTDVPRSVGGAGLAKGAERRGGGRSRRVLGQRGISTRSDCLHRGHEPAAAGGALAQRRPCEFLEAIAVVGRRLGCGLGRGHAQQAPAQGQLLLAVAAGEESEVADAMEVGRQDVEQEAPDC